jgi:hypothetical protein
MRRTAVALFLAGALLGLSACQSALAADSLFPDSLFPDDQNNSFPPDLNVDQSVKTIKQTRDVEAARRAYKDMVERDDQQMRAQMQRVAGWLQAFSLRNQHRFPGVYGSTGSVERAAQVQLTELVGANPYANVTTGVVNQGLNGLSPGLPAYYNNDGSPVANSPFANDEWTAELTADNVGRVKLQMDGSASPGEVDSMRNDPPSTMQAAPGTIVASGNGQGYIYVWGAGIDGNPLRDFNGKIFIVSSQTWNTVEDQGQEADY